MTDTARMDAQLLFSLLVSVRRDKAAVIIRTAPDSNGMAAWHLLNAN